MMAKSAGDTILRSCLGTAFTFFSNDVDTEHSYIHTAVTVKSRQIPGKNTEHSYVHTRSNKQPRLYCILLCTQLSSQLGNRFGVIS
jgi:hypothetical protein